MRHMGWIGTTWTAMALFVSFAPHLEAAADGTPDPGFGTQGRVTLQLGPLGHREDAVVDLFVEPDGSVTLAAENWSDIGPNTIAAVTRLSPNGVTDPGWGNAGGGVSYAGFDAVYDEVRSTAIVRDAAGGLVVGGAGERGGVNNANEDFVLARLDADGLVDPSWGNASTAGTAFVQFDLLVDGDDYLVTLLALPGGGILAVGDAQYAASDRDLAFARFDATGELDETFGAGGKLTVGFDAVELGIDYATDAVLVGDAGAFAVCATVDGPDGTQDLAATRHFAGGGLDGTFGFGGKVRVTGLPALASQDACRALAKIAGGGFVLGGDFQIGSGGREPLLVRLDSTGNLDVTFGSSGRSVLWLPPGATNGTLHDVAIDPQGRILAAGSLSLGSRNVGFVARVMPNGQLDATFGQGGWAILDQPTGGLGLARVAIGPQGVVAGGVTSAGDNAYADSLVVRLLARGLFADGFENGGLGAWSDAVDGNGP